MRHGRYLTTKLVRSLITIWLVVTLTFVALHLSGDPIEHLVGDQAPPEVVEYYRAKFGLDRPLWEQYLAYFGNIAKGDFGLSLSNRLPASTLILQALPRTLLLGLTAFGAVVGLLAGPAALTAIKEHGMSLLVAGALVTLIPPLVTLFFGRYILHLHPMILFGALAGAQTEAASMNKIIEQSGSNTPVIGFTVCYAVSNVLLAVCGPIIIAFA